MTKYKNFFSNEKKNENFIRVITGSQIQRYFVSNNPSQGGIFYLDYEKHSNKELNLSKRIVMQRITGVDSKVRLNMTILDKNYFLSNSTNFIIKDYKYSNEFILGILNSKLMNYYFKVTSTNTNVTTSEINRLPIVKPSN